MHKAVSCSLILISIFFMFLFSECGCYSAMHHTQVIDGPSMALAYRPIHHEIWTGSSSTVDPEGWYPPRRIERRASMVFRYGSAASDIGDWGRSMALSLHHNKEIGGYSSFFPSVDFYVQFPKNNILDFGIGILGFIPYVTIGRNIGTHVALYCELIPLLPNMSPGIQFMINKNLSIFTEANLIIFDDGTATMMTVGIVFAGH
jgi:hypothetical protein